MKLLVLFIQLFLMQTCIAADSNTTANSVNSTHIAQMTVGLLIVLFIIIAIAWIAKRFLNIQQVAGSQIKILGGVSMGTRERLVLIEVGHEQIIVGVTPGSIQKIHVLKEPLEHTTSSTDTSPVFAKLFSRAQQS